ncbi:hypothetical protein IQ244_08685 [Nostoc sp. LEGE 06077]|nr:hypothetical protein [Nostoc sp. LEGE 06077]
MIEEYYHKPTVLSYLHLGNQTRGNDVCNQPKKNPPVVAAAGGISYQGASTN